MELYQMIEKAWVRTFENYLFTAHNVGRVTDIRKALEGIVEHINKSAGMVLCVMKGPEKDDRYFVIELDGVRIATFFKHKTMFEASVMPEITPTIFNTIDTFIHNAIKYMSMFYAHDTMKRTTEPLLEAMQNQSALLRQKTGILGAIVGQSNER